MIPDVFVSLRGRLLVATPALGDPNFDRTVVLMLEHTPEGAVGLVLNRPSGTDLDEGGAEGFQPLLGDIGLANMGGPPRGIDAVRLFAGYAGWADAQLEAEIA